MLSLLLKRKLKSKEIVYSVSIEQLEYVRQYDYLIDNNKKIQFKQFPHEFDMGPKLCDIRHTHQSGLLTASNKI